MKIIILGAGVIGVTTAYYLRKLGHDVTVIDRNAQSAAECSFANGGQLSYSHAEPWATPHALRHIPKWLVMKDSPLVFRPHPDPRMWKWALQFLSRCTTGRKLEATRHILRLAMHSRDCFAEIIADTGIEFSYLNKGTLHIFPSEAALNAEIAQAEFQKQLGCDYKILSTRADCEKLEPALKHSPATITGGVFFPMDASGDVHEFTIKLTKYLQGKGVEFLF
jgi:D-amino-acid dehydrogenase